VDADLQRFACNSSNEGLDLILSCCLEVDPSLNLQLISELQPQQMNERFREIEVRGGMDVEVKRKFNECKSTINKSK